MNLLDELLRYAGTALILAILVGLVVRGRLSRLPSWTVYLVSLAAWQTYTAVWPSRLTFRLWASFETFAVLTTLWIVLELSLRIAGRLPGARRALSLGLLASLAGTLVFLVATPAADAGTSWARLLALGLLPRLNVGIAACFCCVAAAAAVYAVPLDRIHRSVLLGLMVYVLIFVVVLDRLHIAWLDRLLVSRLNASAYVAMLCTWLLAAWRRGEVMGAAPENLKRQWWPWAPAA